MDLKSHTYISNRLPKKKDTIYIFTRIQKTIISHLICNIMLYMRNAMIYILLMKNNTMLIVDVKPQHLVPIWTVVATITTKFWVLINILMYISLNKAKIFYRITQQVHILMLSSHPRPWSPGWVRWGEASQECCGSLSVWYAADLWMAHCHVLQTACHPERAWDVISFNIPGLQ